MRDYNHISAFVNQLPQLGMNAFGIIQEPRGRRSPHTWLSRTRRWIASILEDLTYLDKM